MEWHISPVARKSYLSDREFEKDERVSSALVKTEDGELMRVDVAYTERKQVELPGMEICRWTQIFKPKPTDGKEEEEALKLTADNLFINLFEGEEEEVLTEENSELKHFLALMLERRRVLRVKARTRKYTRYVHRPTKREFLVPQVALEPQFFLENEEKLAFIIDGGDFEGESESGGSDDKEKSDD